MFDPDTFVNQETTDANATTFDPIPEGEYVAMITRAPAVREVGNEGRVVMDVTWEIDDEELKQKLERDRLTVRQSVFLDIEDGKLATGKNKNVQLGKLRDALGQNKPGKSWKPSDLEGAGPARIQVSHRERDGITYDQVARVTAM